MKKKGFTLIELLAVIVILAIIALIAIPLIGNVIEKAKIGALENSVNGLVESANMYYANQSIKGEQAIETVFDFNNGEQTSTEKLEYKGKVYNGKLILHANGEVAVCIDDKEHYAYKNKTIDEVISGVGTCVYDGTTGDFSSNSSINDLNKITSGEIDIVNGKSFSLNIGENKHYIIIHKNGAPATSPLTYLFFLDNDYLIRTWEDGTTTIYNVHITYEDGIAIFSETIVNTYFGTQNDMYWTA